jgi:hypothetical protein
MQDAIDVSLLSGANTLFDDQTKAVQSTQNYWVLNGFKSNEIKVKTNYNNDAYKMKAIATRTISFYFLPIIGFKSTNITVSTIIGLSSPAFGYIFFRLKSREIKNFSFKYDF